MGRYCFCNAFLPLPSTLEGGLAQSLLFFPFFSLSRLLSIFLQTRMILFIFNTFFFSKITKLVTAHWCHRIQSCFENFPQTNLDLITGLLCLLRGPVALPYTALASNQTPEDSSFNRLNPSSDLFCWTTLPDVTRILLIHHTSDLLWFSAMLNG